MEILKKIKILIFGTVWLRFVLVLFAAGVGLITGPDIFLVLLKIFYEKVVGKNLTLNSVTQPDIVAQIFGMILCFISIGMFLYFNDQEKRQKQSIELENYLRIQKDIIEAEANDRPFTEEQLNWFRENPIKEELFFSIVKNGSLSRREQIRRLKNDLPKAPS